MSREIDTAIAEHIMGWQWVQHSPQQAQLEGYQGNNPRWLADPKWIEGLGDDPTWVIVPANMNAPVHVSLDLPHYCEDIAAAWGIAEALHGRGFNVQVSALHDWRAPYECTIWWPGTDGNGAAVLGSVDAPTAPMAICLAGLRAVGVQI